MKLDKRMALPLVVLAIGMLGTLALVSARPTVATHATGRTIPLVQVVQIETEPVEIRIRAQGSVVPRTESGLVAEVAGRVTQVSPELAPGAFFDAGDLLLEIDPGDYEVALERARANLARAESELELALANLGRRRNLAEQGVSSTADLENAQNAERVAEAVRREATAAARQARRDLGRTRIEAPFAGRVREKHVDVGEFVARGAAIATIYAVDYAEVRLPISDEEAAFVDLPIDYRDGESGGQGPEVLLRARFAGREHSWSGHIVRTEGELDPRTRMIHAVARVEDPYGRGEDPDRPPLSVGLFVEAEIRGRRYEDMIALPRAALRGNDEVALVSDDEQLTLRKVEVFRRERDRILIGAGLSPGERVCVSPIALAVEGMPVRAAQAESAGKGS